MGAIEDMTGDGYEWHSYHLYVGTHYDALDYLIAEALGEPLRLAGARRWFFLRYIDEGGLHLRVRLERPSSDPVGDEQRVYGALHDALAALASLPPTNYAPLISFKGAMPPADGVKRIVQCKRVPYQPETDQYGGGGGVDIAEDVFQASSNAARSILRQEAAGELDRKDLALPLMIGVLQAYVPHAAVAAFVDRYSTYWLSGSADIGSYKAAFADKAYEMIDDGQTIVPDVDAYDSRTRAVLSPWQDALQRSQQRYRRECSSYSGSLADTVAFQFIHLMNNRLGFTMLEEAYLAVLLAKAYENGLRHAHP